MDRSIPYSNKIVFKRMVDKNRQIHLAKLGNIKSTLSKAAPYRLNQAQANKKKAQVNEDRLTEIERENRLLLDKLTVIMRSTSQNPVSDQNVPRSLNKDSRKRDLVKITIENQAFLRRLQDQRSHYNRNEWTSDRKQQEVYLKNISEYPMNLTYLNNSTMGTDEERPKTFQQGHRNKASRFPSFATTTSEKMSASARHPETLKKLQPSKNFRGEKLDPVKPKSMHKTMLYQVKKKIGFSNYMIHFYLHNDTFNIMASNNERADLKTLTTSIKEGQDLLLRYNGDYEELVNRIRFKGANIVIGDNSLYVESAKKEGHLNGEIAETQDENDVELNHEEERTPKNLNSSHLSKKSNNARKPESEANLSDNKPQETNSEKEVIKGEDDKPEEQGIDKHSVGSEVENEKASLQKIESKSDNGSRKSNIDNEEKSEKVKARASSELQNQVEEEEYAGRESPEKESKVSEEVQEDYEEEFEG